MYTISTNLQSFEHDGLIFKLDYCEPSEYAKDVARKTLRETPENVETGLKELRRLLKEESKLHCPLDNDLWLLSFLRPAHFYPHEALKMILHYYNYRQKYPDVVKGLNLATVKGIMNAFNGSTLPQRDQYGRRIYTALIGENWDRKQFETELHLKSLFLQSQYLRSEPETQICGIVILLDVLGLSLQQAVLFTPGIAQRLVQFIQHGMGIRLMGYHILNQPKMFDMVFALVKPLINGKLAKRVHFHGSDMSSLHRFISPECLPECYGGTLKAAKSYGPEFYKLYERYESDYDKLGEYGYKK